MQTRWYEVPTAWLVIAVLGATVIGSAWLIHAAMAQRDRNVIEHSRSSMPPAQKPETAH
ncbi:hypothetical protein [Tahibacter amnicola]|uniref:Uncharacterized protein n=1 Tax=Tahibacter amnicola TaxID=2976241 RepID=A0ABY6BF13_9GAMM|nr:hypothetical protein [Tahibacter amnicola]UXI66477.1 hypothetical protein N4264_17200 [Tahibacter amnicola]